jgi:hypothetical protein
MKSRLMYIERKYGLRGPARIGWVRFSQTGRTLYYAGHAFRSVKGRGTKFNHYDVASGETYWISGPRRDGNDPLYPATVEIDEDAREAYWRDVRGLPERVADARFTSPGKYNKRSPA